jgi:hypothetical protein
MMGKGKKKLSKREKRLSGAEKLATLLGMNLALVDMLRAIVQACPDKSAVAATLAVENLETLSAIGKSPQSDQMAAAYKKWMGVLRSDLNPE